MTFGATLTSKIGPGFVCLALSGPLLGRCYPGLRPGLVCLAPTGRITPPYKRCQCRCMNRRNQPKQSDATPEKRKATQSQGRRPRLRTPAEHIWPAPRDAGCPHAWKASLRPRNRRISSLSYIHRHLPVHFMNTSERISGSGSRARPRLLFSKTRRSGRFLSAKLETDRDTPWETCSRSG